MHIVVTGGGTGGHIFPAIEIIKAFNKNQNVKVTLVGNKNSLEEKIASKEGIDFFGITTKQVLGKSFFKKFLALFYLKMAFLHCIYFLLKHRTKAVIGVGGYISVPMVLAAFVLRKKRFICEQNVSPGLANKALSHLVNAIFISFDESKNFFPLSHKFFLTGNPVRKKFFNVQKNYSPTSTLKILVSGGSLGAKILNVQVAKALELAKQKCPDLQIEVTHQTGKDSASFVKENYEKVGINAQVLPFIDDMPLEFEKHDLLICRAGATTCAEITAAGMPSILVPYLFANAHQKDNALSLVKAHAGIMVEENDNFAYGLAQAIVSLYKNPAKLAEMSVNAKKLSFPDAAEKVVKNVLSTL